jgi:hypothetical protein
MLNLIRYYSITFVNTLTNMASGLVEQIDVSQSKFPVAEK